MKCTWSVMLAEVTSVWYRVLHFSTTQPSSAGNYTCAANYKRNTDYQSVEIQVSGEWSIVWVSRLSVTNWCEVIEGFLDCPYLSTTCNWRLLGMVQLSWTTLSCCPLLLLVGIAHTSQVGTIFVYMGDSLLKYLWLNLTVLLVWYQDVSVWSLINCTQQFV